ncbi:hypothetical protein O181_011843 [Austropuccinia psidii MF-1]|uniref:Uncharacterized protein n=1 Tax=Austropuccinia psidii MF-1 TaxID=1389203 RepID=A0A9Q3BVM7_9BASI|nr:hypothetical protein [Austropuccinia psidii MF-1]
MLHFIACRSATITNGIKSSTGSNNIPLHKESLNFFPQLITLLITCTSTIDIYKKTNLIHSSCNNGAAFTPFQYKQHIKKLKSAIAPQSLPNIPTTVSGSECPPILLDQIFPADYSQLTQRTFSTPPGLFSTAQKPCSRSPKLPPHNLGIIISAILSLRYNIPFRASSILNPALNLLIKSSISSPGGPPTPAFHIPQHLSTIFEHLQLEPLIQNSICCPQCFFLNGLIESVTTDQPHLQRHDDPNDHDPPCTQSLDKFINAFEPCTQYTTKIKKKFIPTKHFIYQPFKYWLSRFLQRAGIMEIMHQHQQSQTP